MSINNISNNSADIIHFEYIKKLPIDIGQVLIGFEFNKSEDFYLLEEEFNKENIKYKTLNNSDFI